MPFTIVRQDITKMEVDTIVNAANTRLAMGGGVCGAIFKTAGAAELQAACDKVAPIATGGAAITPAFSLPCKYVIHAAGPVYNRHSSEESEKLLRSAYTESLKLAVKNNCKSVAFPLISSGIYGYPKKEALAVATDAIQSFLKENEIDVYLAVFDGDSFVVSEQLLGEIESYIDEHYIEELHFRPRFLIQSEFSELSTREIEDLNLPEPHTASMSMPLYSLDKAIGNLDEPFGTTLLRLIDAKGKTDVEVYKRANIDRKLFSKIRTGKGYVPSKRTALALAVALELNIDEATDLLKRAGFTLSHSQKFDVIIEYFIMNKRYDVYEINEVLFKYDQPLLGG